MGLAASQARLLLLTSRKNDVEAQMMSISNDKLAISRKAAELSENYSNALNSQKLAWTSNGLGVSYDMLMHPNENISMGQYMLTNTSTGAVLLDGEYQSLLGLTGAGTSSQFNSLYPNAVSFVAACMGTSTGSVSAGVNSVLAGTASPVDSFTTAYTDSQIFAELYNMDSSSYSRNTGASNVVNFYTCSASVGSGSTNYDASNQSIVSSALDDEVIASTGDVSDALLTVLKSVYGSDWSSDLSAVITEAAAAAQDDTIQFYQSKLSSCTSVSTSNTSAMSSTGGTNKIVNQTSGDDSLYVDRTQIIKTFLAYFDAECANIDGRNDTNPSTFVSQIGASSTTRPSKNGTSSSASVVSATDVSTGDANQNGFGDAYEYSYYVNLYKALASSGWQVAEGVDDENYLQTQISACNIMLNKYSGNAWSSVSSSDTSYPMESVSDDEAINRAEAEYDAAKDKLDYKESMLDVQMNNLDTERSAIETEFTSVQKVIDKNIEHSFKMFQNG